MNFKEIVRKNYIYRQIKENTEFFLTFRHPLITIRYRLKLLFMKKPIVTEFDKSLNILKNSNKSLGRFGDGELRWLLNMKTGYFQKESRELSHRLNEVLHSKNDKFLVGIPNVFNGVGDLSIDDALEWEKLIVKYGNLWSKNLPKDKVYIDANITRPYIDRREKKKSKKYFEMLKQIWNDQNIVILEGSQTRFGVNNDLISNAKTVRRILCPPTNAFEWYQDILDYCLENFEKNENVLFLCALGPTATILSYDLCLNGFRAIDIGHVDVEYEWFLMKTTKKVPLPHKYVNEVDGGNKIDADINDEKYHEEIVKEIGVKNEESNVKRK